ncbi:S8 family serine peptidase [Streptomyces sp. NPDC051452]|uniref:S8 family serine peptidase n=1 Tax=Streptomyces sp. NPDC051452 TaxID=3365654 RepID=UPI0037A9F463
MIDGPVAVGHPGLAGRRVRVLPGAGRGSGCAADTLCRHGTFVAGVLSAGRSSVAPGICPNCTLLVRPVFAAEQPGCRPEQLADAIVETVRRGARVLNLSAASEQPSSAGHRALEGALDYAASRGVIVVAAAGNQGRLGTSVITRHPWTIPVIAYDGRGRPMSLSNLGGSISIRGIGGPGEGIVSLGTGDHPFTITGTSAATPFVSGAVALLMSEFPGSSASEVRSAVTRASTSPRRPLVPPLLDAWAAYEALRGRPDVVRSPPPLCAHQRCRRVHESS